MGSHREKPDEQLAHVSHHGDVLFIALTKTGRNALLKHPLTFGFKEPVQVKTIVMKYMPRKWSREVEKMGRPILKEVEKNDDTTAPK